MYKIFIVLVVLFLSLIWFASTETGERTLKPVIGAGSVENLQNTYSELVDVVDELLEWTLEQVSGDSPTSKIMSIFDTNVEFVKNGTLYSCAHKTVEEMVEGYIGNPRWRSGTTKGGMKFVNVTGEIIYDGYTASVIIQFKQLTNTFELYAVEVNKVPHDLSWGVNLLNKMCVH